MDKIREKQLIEIYPDLFSGIDKRYPIIAFGFECGNGWFELLRELITSLKYLDIQTRDYGDGEGIAIKVEQIKEKYGTLRFYTNFTTDEIDVLVLKAENLSEVTCEGCGSPGILRNINNWLRVSCDRCCGIDESS